MLNCVGPPPAATICAGVQPSFWPSKVRRYRSRLSTGTRTGEPSVPRTMLLFASSYGPRPLFETPKVHEPRKLLLDVSVRLAPRTLRPNLMECFPLARVV